jgi:hypothetical protein
MALRTTIDLDAPDKTDIVDDVTTVPRGTLVDGVYTDLGMIKRTVTHTVKTWVANTYAACTTARTSYAGTGSVRITEQSPVVKAYTLEISEDSDIVVTLIPPEE